MSLFIDLRAGTSGDQSPIEDVITPILTSLRHSLAGGGQTKTHTIPKQGVLAYHFVAHHVVNSRKLDPPVKLPGVRKCLKDTDFLPIPQISSHQPPPTASSSLHHVYLGRSLYLGAYSSQEDYLEVYSGESQGRLYCLFRFVSTTFV